MNFVTMIACLIAVVLIIIQKDATGDLLINGHLGLGLAVAVLMGAAVSALIAENNRYA